MPQIGQRPGNSIVAPITVLLGHAHDQLLDLSADPRSANASTSLRAIEFAGHEVAVPGQDRVRSSHIGHLSKKSASQSITDLDQYGSLGVRDLHPPLPLTLPD